MLLKHRQFIFALGAVVASLSSSAQASFYGNDGWNEAMVVFNKYETGDSAQGKSTVGHRIPAITVAQGNIVAVSDIRYAGLSGNTDIYGSNRVNPVHFGVKVSTDRASTWSDQIVVKPSGLTSSTSKSDEAYLGYISDPAIVYDPVTKKTFLFGYTSKNGLQTTNKDSKFVMFTSEDGGFTWDNGTELKNLVQETGSSSNYTRILQGPGSGMSWNGVLYVAIQQWSTNFASSGYLYSEDNGQTWKKSKLIVQNATNIEDEGKYSTSEASVFHHKGEIYLAARAESKGYTKKRVLYKTNDHGETWTQVDEPYIPDNVARCESSTHALTDELYFVAYSTYDEGLSESTRSTTWITTNTGKRLELMDSPLNSLSGYSSITSDDENLYVLYEGSYNAAEGGEAQTSILLRKFNYRAREFASINRVVLENAKDTLFYQDQMMNEPLQFEGAFGNEGTAFVKSIFGSDRVRVGLFMKSLGDLGQDAPGTIAYDHTNYSALVAVNRLFTQGGSTNDSLFTGYQYSDISFENDANDGVHSFVAGYRLDHAFPWVDYSFGVVGTVSTHHMERNDSEGMGRTASIKSYALTLKNEVGKRFDIVKDTWRVKPLAGLENILFTHGQYTDTGKEDWSQITGQKASNWSHRLYVGAQTDAKLSLNDQLELSIDLTGKYVKQLADEAQWTDHYEIWDTPMVFAAPYKLRSSGTFEGQLSADLNYKKQVSLGVKASYTPDTGARVMGAFEYSFYNF